MTDTIITKTAADLAALKAYLLKEWQKIHHGFDKTEDAIDAAIKEGHVIITEEKAQATPGESIAPTSTIGATAPDVANPPAISATDTAAATNEIPPAANQP